MEPLFLTLDEVLEIHEQQIELDGGSDGIRDVAGLESAGPSDSRRRIPACLHSGYGSRLPFPSLQNHPFIDGNKRMGANASILLINDFELEFEEDELVDLVLSVASGVLTKARLTEIFEPRCKKMKGNS
jgi:death-on-curing protein